MGLLVTTRVISLERRNGSKQDQISQAIAPFPSTGSGQHARLWVGDGVHDTQCKEIGEPCAARTAQGLIMCIAHKLRSAPKPHCDSLRLNPLFRGGVKGVDLLIHR
jgi:hypothetical protein